MIKFVGDLWHCRGFSAGRRVSSTNKADHYDISEILLKVVLNNIISLTLYIYNSVKVGKNHSLNIVICFKASNDDLNISYAEDNCSLAL